MKIDRHQLQTARTLARKTLFEAAEAVGLGRSGLSKIEDGSAVEPEPAVIEKLIAFYEAAGVVFHENGRVELRAGLQRVGGQRVN